MCRSRLSGNWVTAGKQRDRDDDDGCNSKEEEARLGRGEATVVVVVEAPWGRRTLHMVYWGGNWLSKVNNGRLYIVGKW